MQRYNNQKRSEIKGVYRCSCLPKCRSTTKETDMARMSEAERRRGEKEPCTWLSVNDCSSENLQQIFSVLCRETERPKTEMTLC